MTRKHTLPGKPGKPCSSHPLLLGRSPDQQPYQCRQGSGNDRPDAMAVVRTRMFRVSTHGRNSVLHQDYGTSKCLPCLICVNAELSRAVL